MRKKQKGYVLPIAIVAMLLLTTSAVTAMTVVYRYANTVNARRERLAERVFDEPLPPEEVP